MPASTVASGAAASGPALCFERVGKVFCETQNVARAYAMRDILRPRRNRVAGPRPGEWVVLRNISFEVRAGETLLVLGLPGSGKSTVTGLVTGHRVPDEGRVVRRGSVGALGGGKYGMGPYLRLREGIRLMAALQGVRAADLDRTCADILEWTDLGGHADTMLSDLPRSLLTPLSLVGSLIVRHDIYVFDDYAPLGDTELDRRLEQRLEEIQATCACVMTSEGKYVPEHVSEVILLHGGEIIRRGTFDDTWPAYEQLVRCARRTPQTRGAAPHARFRPVPTVEEARSLVLHVDREPKATHSLERELWLLRNLGRPIVVGPCLADPGWEVLFWLPFVRWARRQLGDSPPALALSRGANEPWYADLAGRFVNVYDLLPLEEFTARDQERIHEKGKGKGKQKQTRITDFERELVGLATVRAGLSTDVGVLHPSILLGLLAQIWRGRASIEEVTSRAVYEQLPALEAAPKGLPPRYVMMHFRFSTQFPKTPDRVAFATAAVRAVSARIPVVVPDQIRWESSPDDLDGGRGVHVVDRVTAGNARLQAGIAGGAEAAIGTLMGPTTLAAFLGVPSFCLHAPSGGFKDFQTHAMRHAIEQMRAPVVLAAADATTPDDVSRWLDQVLHARASVHAGADLARNE